MRKLRPKIATHQNTKKHGPGNSLVVFDENKQLFSRSFADGVKSLDLQHIGNGLWLLPNGPSIKIMDSEGIVYWQLDIDNYILLAVSYTHLTLPTTPYV